MNQSHGGYAMLQFDIVPKSTRVALPLLFRQLLTTLVAIGSYHEYIAEI